MLEKKGLYDPQFELDACGVERIYEPPLWDDEVEGLRKAAAAVKELIGLIEAKA